MEPTVNQIMQIFSLGHRIEARRWAQVCCDRSALDHVATAEDQDHDWQKNRGGFWQDFCTRSRRAEVGTTTTGAWYCTCDERTSNGWRSLRDRAVREVPFDQAINVARTFLIEVAP